MSRWSSIQWGFVRFATGAYALMALVGAAIVHWGGGGLASLGRAATAMTHVNAYLGGALVAGILLVAAALLGEWFDSFRGMRRMVKALIGDLPWWAVIWLAACSSVGEELFFRAAIQPFAGLAVTSVVFGLMHIGPDRRVGAWTWWAVAAGFLLGWVFDRTGLIGPVIMAHFIVNAVSLSRIRYGAV